MGRNKIEIKKIENPTSRQVTFAKRRGGLMKKANELSILCDVEVAVLILSTTGKIYEYASSSLRNILERYFVTCPMTLRWQGAFCNTDNTEHQEVQMLRHKVGELQKTLRLMEGHDLASLNMVELHQLENILRLGLHRMRLRKNELIAEEQEAAAKMEATPHSTHDAATFEYNRISCQWNFPMPVPSRLQADQPKPEDNDKSKDSLQLRL